MRFCPTCGRVMTSDPSSGSIVFRCPCGAAEPGTPEDARVAGASLGAGETTAAYRDLIAKAAHDRTNQLVARECPECGLDYAAQLRLGDAEVVIIKCKCGNESAPGAEQAEPPAAAAPGAKKAAAPGR